LNNLSILDRVRLEKCAVDAGFDIKGDPTENWLSYSSTSCPLRIWLAIYAAQPIAALSMDGVLDELRVSRTEVSLPLGAKGALTTEYFDRFQAMLQRAYELANALPQELLHIWERQLEAVSVTERDASVKQRVGQDLFRRGQLALWNGRCALTGLAVPELLRASHAKPWSISSDQERLDVYNGVLLAAHLDAAFDNGFISFTSTGNLQISSRLDASTRALLGLDRPISAIELRSRHLPYLEFHRLHVFVAS
jgi:putative restriction endonuclease